MIKYYSPETEWKIKCGDYHMDSVDWYNNNYKAVLVGWLHFTGTNYYMLDLEDKPEESVTPLMLFHRSGYDRKHSFAFEGERKYDIIVSPTGKRDIVEIESDRFKKRCEDFPWIVMSLGCDDGHKGWMFATKDLAKRWIYYLSITEFKFDDYYNFLKLFDNEGWVN